MSIDQLRTCTAAERLRLTGTPLAAKQRDWCEAHGVGYHKRQRVDECEVYHSAAVSALLGGWSDPLVGSWRPRRLD